MPRSLTRYFRSALAALVSFPFVGCARDTESKLAEARALQEVAQFHASTETLREILEVEPELPEANYRLGLALAQLGEPSRAVWPLEKAAATDEYEVIAGLLLAQTHFQTRNFDECVRTASRVIDLDPERVSAIRLRAQAHLSSRNLDSAIADTTRLIALEPDDYGIRALHATVLADLGRLDEAEREHEHLKQLGHGSEDPDVRFRSCIAPAVFASDVLQDLVRAKALYEECLEAPPSDPLILAHLVKFFDAAGEPARATKLLQDAAHAAPDDLTPRTRLAERLRATGDVAGAESLLLESVELFGTTQSWNSLADFYRARGDAQKALHAISKVRELTGKDDGILFTEADVLLDLGHTERAAELAQEIETPVYRDLIEGRVALVRGDAKSALVAFERGINVWPNNAGARFLAGLAARDLGDFDRAASELREAVRANNAETEAAIELARILFAQGKHRQAAVFANMALRGPRGEDQSDAYMLAARAYAAEGQFERAFAALAALEKRGNKALATQERAVITREQHGPQTAVAGIRAADLDLDDPVNLGPLQQLVESLTQLERTQEALTAIDSALERTPNEPALYELRGLALGRGGDAGAARSAFQRALALDAKRPQAMRGLATLAASDGDLTSAIALFDRAYALAPTLGDLAYAAAQLSRQRGNRQDATKRLRDIVAKHPGVPAARNDLAWVLAETGQDLDTALALATQAQQQNPSPEVLDTIGWVHLKRGEAKQAVGILERAVAERAESPAIRYHLGLALRDTGDLAGAKKMFESALSMGDFTEASQTRAELARLGS